MNLFCCFHCVNDHDQPPYELQSFKNSNNAYTLIFRAFAAGTILALALIHVMGDGVSALSVVSDYPVGERESVICLTCSNNSMHACMTHYRYWFLLCLT